MKIEVDKIKKLPPDIKQEFIKMYLKHNEKKKVENINTDCLSFVKHVWPEFIEGYHHKKIADKFNQLGEEQQIAAKKKFQKIQEAYQHLKKEREIK